MKQKATRILWFSDAHWSDRDEAAVSLVEKAAESFKPHIIVDLGDLLNCDAFSRHPRQTLDEHSQYDYLETELKPAYQWSCKMEEYASNQYVQLAGNHDAWYDRYLAAVDDGRRAFRSLRPSVYMAQNRTKKFRYIPYALQHGDRHTSFHIRPGVLFTHGWCESKFAADAHLQKSKPYSVVFGHTHRIESRTCPMYDGRYVTAINAGCLCKRQPKYNHGTPTEWGTGFGVMYAGRRSFTAYPIAIHKSTCVLPSGLELKV